MACWNACTFTFTNGVDKTFEWLERADLHGLSSGHQYNRLLAYREVMELGQHIVEIWIRATKLLTIKNPI